MQRIGRGLLVLVACAAGCGPGAADEPEGELLWRAIGGFCDGPCPNPELYRDDDALDLRKDGDSFLGAWTAAGLAEYAAASAEVAAGPDDPEPTSCIATDGVDQELVLESDGEIWTVRFCASGDPPPHLVRADALMERLFDALQACESDEYVEPDC
jgi:hypothetical protein